MEIADELIQRFLQGRCKPEEADAVAVYLRQHPERLAVLLGGDDWQAAGDTGVSDHDPELVLQEMKRRLFRGEGKPLLRRLGRSAAAAVLLVLAGTLVWLIRAGQRRDLVVARPAAVEVSRGPAAAVRVEVMISRVNPTGESQRLSLPDGSTVVLYAHSALHYTDSFGLARRDVRLEGKAALMVARDNSHPFRVLTGRLATVVLGTSFEVRAPAGTGDVAVRLYSGKVVIRSLQSLPGWRDVLLTPGEEMLYDDRRMTVKVNKPAARPESSSDSTGGMNDLVFNNSPLKLVFQRLSLQYHKKIVYRNAELRGLNFTGTLMRTDSLNTILSLLSTMNNLDIHEDPAGIIVTRRKDKP